MRSMKIAKILPTNDYQLRVYTEEGQEGLFDVSPYLASGIFKFLKEKDNFDNVWHGRYYVEWACGAESSADTIEARWKVS